MIAKKTGMIAIFWLLAVAGTTASAQTDPELQPPIRPDQAGGPTLLLQTSLPGLYVPAPAVETRIDLQIRGVIVRGTVTQTFENPADQCVESLYVFPLPENAAVDQLVMTTAGRRIIGEIREKEEARSLYEDAKREGKRASLLEQNHPNMFRMSLSSLAPRETVIVEIGYQQVLSFRDGRYGLRMPLVVGPRYHAGDPSVKSEPASALPVLQYRKSRGPGTVQIFVDLDPGVPLRELESSSHAIEAVPIASHQWKIALENPVKADRDFVLAWTPELGRQPLIASFTESVRGKDGPPELYTLLTFLPPSEEFGQKSAQSRELVVIIDTSGSMSGGPLEQAKQAVDLALSRLNPADRFHLIEFNSVTRSMRAEPVWVDRDTIEEARRWIDRLEAQGGTEMLPALKLALDDGNPRRDMLRQVIFITDGMVSNEQQLIGHVRARIGRSRLFTVGIGSAPNGHLMRSLARQGRGTFTYIDSLESVSETMGELFTMIEHPALTNLSIETTDPDVEMASSSIPDLYAGEPVIVTIRHTRPDPVFTVKGTHSRRLFTRTVSPDVRVAAISGIEKLWARDKIAALEELRLDSDATEVRPEIVEVALRHGLVSSYTSLVAIDQSSAGAPDSCEPVLLPLELPAGMDEASAATLPGTATSSQWLLLIGLLLITIAATTDVVAAEIERRKAAHACAIDLGSEEQQS